VAEKLGLHFERVVVRPNGTALELWVITAPAE
jgi:hypothetical protein